MLNFNYYNPTRVVFGKGTIDQVGALVAPYGKKVLLHFGGGSIRKNGVYSQVAGSLKKAGLQVVELGGVVPNPRLSLVREGIQLCRDEKIDMILAVDGGSVIDSAKAICLAATKEAPFWQGFEAGVYEGVAGLPLVAVPTTAGTGSEGNGAALICGEPGKRGFMHPSFFPALAIVDPELTASMPPRLTAVTGMDAFFHAVECFLSNSRQPMSDMLCLEAAHLVTRFLPQAVEQGDDLNARTALAWASNAAGMALALASPISQHALEYSFSGSGRGSEHGAGLVVLSRPYFRHLIELAQAQGQEDTLDRLLNVAVAMGFGADADDDGGHPFLVALQALLEAVGLDGLRAEDMGYSAQEIPAYVAAAMQLKDARNFTNTPVAMTEADVQVIYKGVFSR